MADEIKIISKLVKIPIKKLHIQFIPVVTPMDIWNYDMSLKHSPHVELLRFIYKHGFDWKKIMKSRFARIRQHRYVMGMDKWTNDRIKEHVRKRWDIFESLRKKSFIKKKSKKKPIIVLEVPFWQSRFGYKAKWLKGPELWNGGRRCAAARVLGWETIPGFYAVDRYPGTKRKGRFENKLLNVEGVFE